MCVSALSCPGAEPGGLCELPVTGPEQAPPGQGQGQSLRGRARRAQRCLDLRLQAQLHLVTFLRGGSRHCSACASPWCSPNSNKHLTLARKATRSVLLPCFEKSLHPYVPSLMNRQRHFMLHHETQEITNPEVLLLPLPWFLSPLTARAVLLCPDTACSLFFWAFLFFKAWIEYLFQYVCNVFVSKISAACSYLPCNTGLTKSRAHSGVVVQEPVLIGAQQNSPPTHRGKEQNKTLRHCAYSVSSSFQNSSSFIMH